MMSSDCFRFSGPTLLFRRRDHQPARRLCARLGILSGAVAVGLTLMAVTVPLRPGICAPAQLAQATPSVSTDDIPHIDSDHAVLRWLDKSTARVDKVSVPVGTPVTLGGVQVTALACRRTAPDQTPEHAAFLSISEHKPGEDPRQVFQGWMFSSSPSLSAMEHPIYDVWVLECRDGVDPEDDDREEDNNADTASESATGSQ